MKARRDNESRWIPFCSLIEKLQLLINDSLTAYTKQAGNVEQQEAVTKFQSVELFIVLVSVSITPLHLTSFTSRRAIEIDF